MAGHERVGPSVKTGYHSIEICKTTFVVPLRYTNLEPVGSGAYGQVCAADDNKLGIKVAIKKVGRPFQTRTHAKRTYRELRLLRHMDHDNVIGLYDIFTPAKNLDEFEDVYLVTHLMAIDMHKLMKTQSLTSDHVKFFTYQILRGLKYVHSAGIIHRDLKTSNIAINEENELRILDFGLARQADEEMTGYVFTRWYRAPEVILNWTKYKTTADIWSVGCIMAEMLTRKPLIPGADHIDQLQRTLAITGKPSEELLKKIESDDARKYVQSLPNLPKRELKDIMKGIDPEALNLLERMLDLDPDSRITSEQALAHPYFQTYADPTDEPSSEPYDAAFESEDYEIDEWKIRVVEEINNFKPKIAVVTEMDQ